MQYSNNDLWSVRQIEFLKDALEGYEGKEVDYYPERNLSLSIPEIADYNYIGVLHFPGQDRTIILEQGEDFGLKEDDILEYLKEKNIQPNIIH
jgi:hypothetical protein